MWDVEAGPYKQTSILVTKEPVLTILNRPTNWTNYFNVRDLPYGEGNDILLLFFETILIMESGE